MELKLNRIAAAGALLLGIASQTAFADVVFINFDGAGAVAGAAIGSFYSAQGVTFTNAQWNLRNGDFGSSSPFIAIGITSSFNPKASSPIVMTFSSAISSFSLDAINAGSLGARIDAYDAEIGGNLIATDDFFGVGAGGTVDMLSLTGSNIRRIAFYQPNAGQSEGVGFDNITFNVSPTGTVPEPASWALAGLALAGLAATRRRVAQRQPK